MTEEINKEELKAALEEEPVVEVEGGEDEYSESEQEAMEHGWRPEGVEGKLNLSAEEFMDRQKLYDEIRNIKKENRKLHDGMEALTQFNKTVEEKTRQRTVEELKAQKKLALENENYDAVVQIDEAIADAKVVPTEDKNVAFEQWIDNNEWYHDEPDMKAYADMVGTGYYQQNPSKSVSEVYDYVATEVKARFPDKFENSNRTRPNPVEGAVKGRKAPKSKYSAKDLPEDDRRIMETIVRAGGITKEEYLKQYFG